jgi:hypothetical protein
MKKIIKNKKQRISSHPGLLEAWHGGHTCNPSIWEAEAGGLWV